MEVFLGVAHVWLNTRVGSLVDIEMGFLVETLRAILDRALIAFLSTLGAACVVLQIGLSELCSTGLSRSIRSSLGRSSHVRRGNGGTYHRSTLIARWSFLWWGALGLCLNSLHESIDFSTKIGIIASVYTSCGAEVLAVRSHKRGRIARNIPLWL